MSETPNETSWSMDDAERTYHISRWGDGYFTINQKGNLTVLPNRDLKGAQIDIAEVIEEMHKEGISLPAVIRFHDILRMQVKVLNRTFREVIEESNYEGRFMGVYPIKVNQMREVVEEIVDAGAPYHFGLEAGSKPELLSVLALNTNKHSLTVLNGYKDEDYLKLALLGLKMGRNMIVVVEKFSELTALLRLSEEMKIKPMVGLRGRMSVKGRGKWAGSSGERAKFGLTTPELINAVNLLKEKGLADCLKLFHFHIGSQITDIRTIKDAITEGARIYAKLIKMGAEIRYMDVGGGLGVDYDGSRSTNESSVNYSLNDYCEDIVYGLKQICDLEEVPHPNIITESGRFITAHHSCVITKVVDRIDTSFTNFETKRLTDEHHIVTNMRDLTVDINADNLQTIFSEAQQIKEDTINAFRLGVISLEERAKVETLYWQIQRKIVRELKNMDFIPEELTHLEDAMAPQYLCNFSIFQSAADSWAIDQLLPVSPISRLNEKPTEICSLADITCDSDGKIDKFIGMDDTHSTIPLHDIRSGEDYYIGLFLTGAYQDVMGDMHNLFGRLNEVHVFSDENDPSDFYIEEHIRGNSSQQVLSTMQYNPEYMGYVIKKAIDKQVQRGKITPREGVKLVDFYEECLNSYTYLK
jgi:arginine decarboxylase